MQRKEKKRKERERERFDLHVFSSLQSKDGNNKSVEF